MCKKENGISKEIYEEINKKDRKKLKRIWQRNK